MALLENGAANAVLVAFEGLVRVDRPQRVRRPAEAALAGTDADSSWTMLKKEGLVGPPVISDDYLEVAIIVDVRHGHHICLRERLDH